MKLLTSTGFADYELLDSGNGKRLERFGKYTLSRPDPQCIWQPQVPQDVWGKADAVFVKDADGKEKWIRQTDVPQKWLMSYQDISFYAKLSPFKHTGVFPEQHLMWDFARGCIEKAKQAEPEKETNILNLFGYTGIATLVCAAAGARVTHVDASYPTIGWARENQEVSELSEKPIRWIEDDCLKFVSRELKRGVTYDGIIMDPPIFGHGPEGQRWEFFESFPTLLEVCMQLLVEKPLFIVVNAYAISASSIMLENVLQDSMKVYGGTVESGELILESSNGRQLSTGIYSRWSREFKVQN